MINGINGIVNYFINEKDVNKAPAAELDPAITRVALDKVQSVYGAVRFSLSPLSKGLSWVKWYSGELPEPLRRCKDCVGNIKGVIPLCEFPKKVKAFKQTLYDWRETLASGATATSLGVKTSDVYVEGSGIAKRIASAVCFGRDMKLFTLSVRQLLILEYMGFIGTIGALITSAKKLYAHGKELADAELGSHRSIVSLMKLLANLCLFIISLSGIVLFAFEIASETVVLLLLSSVQFLLSLCSDYYKKHYVESEELPIEKGFLSAVQERLQEVAKSLQPYAKRCTIGPWSLSGREG